MNGLYKSIEECENNRRAFETQAQLADPKGETGEAASQIGKLELTLAGGEVQRWHSDPRIEAQTVAAHSWGVLVIAIWLDWHIGYRAFFEGIFHDVTEKFSGDIPAPFKLRLHELAPGLEREEERIAALMFFPDLAKGVSLLVQFADKLEALRWTYKSAAHDARALNVKITAAIRAMPRHLGNDCLSDNANKRIDWLLEAWSFPQG